MVTPLIQRAAESSTEVSVPLYPSGLTTRPIADLPRGTSGRRASVVPAPGLRGKVESTLACRAPSYTLAPRRRFSGRQFTMVEIFDEGDLVTAILNAVDNDVLVFQNSITLTADLPAIQAGISSST